MRRIIAVGILAVSVLSCPLTANPAGAAPVAGSDSVPAVVAQLVPWVYLYPGDKDGPDSTANFIAHSALHWSHDGGCPDLTFADTGDVDAAKLGNGSYPSVEVESSEPFCSPHGQYYKTNDYTRPYSGDAGQEGFYLNAT